MSCLLPLKSKTRGSSPSPHRRGEKNNSKKQCNAVPPTHPPQPLHQVNSTEEPSNCWARKALHLICIADKAWRGATATALPSPPAKGPTCCCTFFWRQKQRIFPHMHFPAYSKYLMQPSLLVVPISQEVVRKGLETSLLSSLLALAWQFLGQLSPPPCLEHWPRETSQAETTKVPTSGW